MRISINYQLSTTSNLLRRDSVGDCLDQVDLGVPLWGIFLITLADVGNLRLRVTIPCIWSWTV